MAPRGRAAISSSPAMSPRDPLPALPVLRSAAGPTLVPLLVLTVLAPRASLGAVPGTPLADGTRVDRWTLKNGLRVVARHVPGARTSAATLAYRLGMTEDPPKQEGLAEL